MCIFSANFPPRLLTFAILQQEVGGGDQFRNPILREWCTSGMHGGVVVGCLNRSSENKQFAISAGGCFIVRLIMLRRANLGSNTSLPPTHQDHTTATESLPPEERRNSWSYLAGDIFFCLHVRCEI